MAWRTKSGFTAVDLIILLAILSVLAVIVWPSTCECPSVGKRIAVARADMRSLAMALEAYRLDHDCYPATCPLTLYPLVKESTTTKEIERFAEKSGAGRMTSYDISCMSTPVAYLSGLIYDRFTCRQKMPFAYHCTPDWWIIVSPGPDEKYDIDPTAVYDGDTTAAIRHLTPLTYDPTNGTVSGGDIWKIKEW